MFRCIGTDGGTGTGSDLLGRLGKESVRKWLNYVAKSKRRWIRSDNEAIPYCFYGKDLSTLNSCERIREDKELRA